MRKLKALLIAVVLPFITFAHTGEVVKSFDTPEKHPTGLAFDGEKLWLADRMSDLLYAIDPESGEVLHYVSSPGYWPMGLTWDGKALWNADVKGGIPLAENYDGKVYRIDPEDGTVLRTISAPGDSPRGLTWDGEYLWCVDDRMDKVIQFDPDDGTTIRSFDSPAGHPQGLTYDGTYLWVSDRITDEIYMINPEDGSVIIITEAPGPYARGLATNGEKLWAVDSEDDKLYELVRDDGEKFAKFNKREATVNYTYQATNYGPGKVETMDVHLAIPEERKNQKIIDEIEYSPKYTDIVTDKWGQKTAHYRFKNMKAGETRTVHMKTRADLWDVRHYVWPHRVGSLDDIPGEITNRYLENNEKYQIDHPSIQNAVKKSVGNETNPYWMARNIFNYIIDNMYYEMVGGWNTAPAVLERGNGSCSEYSFVYIAMCRAAGIPARYVGSLVVRGDDASMDDVFHRWVEIYLPNFGWIPVDPSGGDQKTPRGQARYIGFTANRFLITTQSGGGSETMGWTYNSNESWTTEPKTYVVTENFADWEPVE
ncbi:MAG: hypothetical protein K9I94_04535 [Bacteroidales bacterium]|nr:hypothetical protein [Bacteroidales bacterium]